MREELKEKTLRDRSNKLIKFIKVFLYVLLKYSD